MPDWVLSILSSAGIISALELLKWWLGAKTTGETARETRRISVEDNYYQDLKDRITLLEKKDEEKEKKITEWYIKYNELFVSYKLLELKYDSLMQDYNEAKGQITKLQSEILTLQQQQ